MAITIKYTKYIFHPPDHIPSEMTAAMRTLTLPEFRESLNSAHRADLHAYIAQHPKTHGIAMWFITAFFFCLLYYTLLGILFTIQGQLPTWASWDNTVHRTFVILSGICFFAIFLVFRSHLESYSSLQAYLIKRKKFYLKAKKQLDKNHHLRHPAS